MKRNILSIFHALPIFLVLIEIFMVTQVDAAKYKLTIAGKQIPVNGIARKLQCIYLVEINGVYRRQSSTNTRRFNTVINFAWRRKITVDAHGQNVEFQVKDVTTGAILGSTAKMTIDEIVHKSEGEYPLEPYGGVLIITCNPVLT